MSCKDNIVDVNNENSDLTIFVFVKQGMVRLSLFVPHLFDCLSKLIEPSPW